MYQRLRCWANNKPTLVQYLRLLVAAVMPARVDSDQAAAAVSVLASRIQIKGGQVATRWLLKAKSRDLFNPL